MSALEDELIVTHDGVRNRDGTQLTEAQRRHLIARDRARRAKANYLISLRRAFDEMAAARDR